MSKVWFVTGSNRGLGRAVVEAALAAGDKVVATARTPSALSSLQAQHPDSLHTFALDVTNAEAAAEAVAFALEAFGRIDVLVNNAGYGRIEPFEQMSDADFRAQIDTNFYGVVHLCREVLPHMRARRSGHIFNVSSIGGRIASPGLTAYQAAKWAVSGYSECLAQEVAVFGVTVTALEPGGMSTDWGATAGSGLPPVMPDYAPSVGAILQMLEGYRGHEVGDPAKVARLMVELSARDDLPSHLVLGSDALMMLEHTEAARRATAEAWLPASRSVDREGVDLGLLAKLMQG